MGRGGICQVTVRPSDKATATSAVHSSTVVQRTARLWAVMATGEMEVVLFLIRFLTPSGVVRGVEGISTWQSLWCFLVFCRLHSVPRQMISSFCHGLFALLWCYATLIGNHRRFETVYGCHHRGSSKFRDSLSVPFCGATFPLCINHNAESECEKKS